MKISSDSGCLQTFLQSIPEKVSRQRMLEVVALLAEQIARDHVVIVVARNVRALLELERQQPDALAALPAEHVRQVYVLGGMPQPDAVGAGGPRSARHHRVQLRSDGREPAQLQVPLDNLDPVAGQDALGREPKPHHRLLDPVGGRFERRVKVLLQVGELFRMLDRRLLEQPGQHVGRVHGGVAILLDRFVRVHLWDGENGKEQKLRLAATACERATHPGILEPGQGDEEVDRIDRLVADEQLQRIVKQCLEWALAAECLWAEQLQRQRGKAQQAARREHLRNGGLHLHVLSFVIVHQAGGGVD
uniref:Uncharacterized protein n=1 Tax=Anopheles melas TaxID=34690 RepID=A0A182TSL8_9DIPT